MKTVKKIIWGIILLYIQVILATKLQILGIVPNLLIAYVVFIAVFLPIEISIPWVFLMGIAYDLTYPTLLGLNAISFLIIVYIVNSLYKSVNKGRFSVVLMGLALMNAVYYLIYILYYLISSQLISSSIFNIFLALTYNTLISVILIYILVLLDRIKLHFDV